MFVVLGLKTSLILYRSRREFTRILKCVINKHPQLFTHVLCLFHQNLFTVESVNCICVDWKSGSKTGYTQASQNIRIVGAEVAYFVEVLQVTTSKLYKSPSTLLSGILLQKKEKKCCRYDNYERHFSTEIRLSPWLQRNTQYPSINQSI